MPDPVKISEPYGDTLEIVAYATARDAVTVLAGATVSSWSFRIAADPAGPALLTFSGAPWVTLEDAPTGRFRIVIPPSDLASLTEGGTYYASLRLTVSGNVQTKWAGILEQRRSI